MHRLTAAAIVATCVAGQLPGQAPPAPGALPPTVLDPVVLKPAGPLSPAEVTKQRAATIKALKEDLRSFDPATVAVRQVEGRWAVLGGSELLRDFGQDRGAALETARLIQDLRINQIGTMSGCRPPLLYGLTDGKAPRGSNARITVMPISARTIRAESVGGTWVLTDGSKGLYDFGTDAESARQAAVLFWKYGFNQVGVIGGPEPVLLVPLIDPRQKALDKSNPLPNPTPLGVIQDVSRTSLLLPGNVYAGPKTPIDSTKLQVVRRSGDCLLVHGDEVLGQFGANESTARGAMKALQAARVTEVVRVGEVGFPLFLSTGQPVHGAPLGAMKTSIRGDRLKVQKVRDSWWVFEDIRPVIEAGTKADAELLVLVIRYFDLKSLSQFGRPDAGLKILTLGR
jgi:hypothetical protein